MATNESANVTVELFRSHKDLASVEIFHNYPDALLQFAYGLCIVFILIGVPANLITIVALALCRKFRNATAIFIINLHISNFIFCCVVLPVTASTFASKRWVYGETMCNIYPLMKYALNAVAHFNVVAITINRYIIICHPQIYPRLYKRNILILCLISTWVLGFSLFLPSFFGVWGKFDLDPVGAQCTLCPDENNVSPKAFFLVLAFAGPYTIFIICYSRIWWTVRKAAKKRIGHNARVVPPTMSNSSSDTSAVEHGMVCREPLPDESSTDDDSSNNDNSVALDNTNNTIEQTKNSNNFRNIFKAPGNAEKLHLPTRKDKKLATVIFAIMVSFILCHLPIMLSRLVYGQFKTEPIANILVHLVEYSNVVLSPLIYVMMSSEYRRVYTSLFKEIKVLLKPR